MIDISILKSFLENIWMKFHIIEKNYGLEFIQDVYDSDNQHTIELPTCTWMLPPLDTVYIPERKSYQWSGGNNL